MPLTNENLFEFNCHIARRLIAVDRLLLETINVQHSLGLMLSAALPDLPKETRAKMQGDYSRAQSTLEHLEAATSQFHHTIEDFIKLHS